MVVVYPLFRLNVVDYHIQSCVRLIVMWTGCPCHQAFLNRLLVLVLVSCLCSHLAKLLLMLGFPLRI